MTWIAYLCGLAGVSFVAYHLGRWKQRRDLDGDMEELLAVLHGGVAQVNSRKPCIVCKATARDDEYAAKMRWVWTDDGWVCNECHAIPPGEPS